MHFGKKLVFVEDFNSFIGQNEVKNKIKILINSAKNTKSPLPHILLYGRPGVGKNTLVKIIAQELGYKLIYLPAPSISKVGELVGIFSSIKENTIIFIDEIHRMHSRLQESVYGIMDNGRIDFIVNTGTNARHIKLPVPPFSIIGATNYLGQVSQPFISRFRYVVYMTEYTIQDIAAIITYYSNQLCIKIDHTLALSIAKRCKGSPRTAIHLLQWLHDYLISCNTLENVSIETLNNLFLLLEIDEEGLNEVDRKILKFLTKSCKGEPAGIKTICVAIGEDEDTIMNVHEPYLISSGFLRLTPRGRQALEKAFLYFNKK